jgi:hypothetical protein
VLILLIKVGLGWLAWAILGALGVALLASLAILRNR